MPMEKKNLTRSIWAYFKLKIGFFLWDKLKPTLPLQRLLNVGHFMGYIVLIFAEMVKVLAEPIRSSYVDRACNSYGLVQTLKRNRVTTKKIGLYSLHSPISISIYKEL